jgi:hypothetical protein
MRAESDWVTAVAVGRIQDKTRWTKALGVAVTVVFSGQHVHHILLVMVSRSP